MGSSFWGTPHVSLAFAILMYQTKRSRTIGQLHTEKFRGRRLFHSTLTYSFKIG